jgi:hypothetical protein
MQLHVSVKVVGGIIPDDVRSTGHIFQIHSLAIGETGFILNLKTLILGLNVILNTNKAI